MRQSKSKIDAALAVAASQLKTQPLEASAAALAILEKAEASRYYHGQAEALRILAQVHAQSDLLIAKDYAVRAIELYDKLGEISKTAGLLMVVAKYYQHAGWLNRAHFVLQDAYESAIRGDNYSVLAAALFNLGSNAEDRGDYASALTSFTKAKTIARDHSLDAIFWRAMAAEQEMNYALANGEFSLESVQEAVQWLSQDGCESSLIELLGFLSRVASDRGDVLSAQSYLKWSFRLARKIHDEASKAEIIYLIAIRRQEAGRFASAKKLLSQALRAAVALKSRTLELNCYRNLAEINFSMGDSAAAYKLLKHYTALNSDLYHQETERHFEEMRTMQQVHMVEEESKQLRKRNSELWIVNERLEAALLETRKLQKELQRIVTIDELTGALNRREIVNRGAEFVARFHSQARPSAVMIVDIDHFKSINDNFGHAAGDEILRRFTKSCQRVLRPTDFFGRLGGEEFCVLLDRTKLDVAMRVAERIMNSIRSTRVADVMGDRILTASIGLVEVNADHDSIEAALQHADMSLYEAKGSGRDKICVFGVKKKKVA